MSTLKGHLLIASRNLRDPNFHRTVILLLNHDESGAFGVVLNRPSDRTVRELWTHVSEDPCHNEDPLYFGGPVEGALLVLHSEFLLSEHEVLPGVYSSVARDNLEQIIREPGHQFRVYFGYAGWAEGQLEGELDEGAWLTVPAELDHVFWDNKNDLWDVVTKSIADETLRALIDVPQLPDDPSVN